MGDYKVSEVPTKVYGAFGSLACRAQLAANGQQLYLLIRRDAARNVRLETEVCCLFHFHFGCNLTDFWMTPRITDNLQQGQGISARGRLHQLDIPVLALSDTVLCRPFLPY